MKILATLLAVAFLIAAIVYLIPGAPLGFHLKHAILCLVLSGLALIWLRFLSKAATPTSAR